MSIYFTFYKAMDISLKSWEFLIEVSGEIEIVNDALIKALTRNQQGNAWRIWRY